jgi:KDO2-lipid IV(A) lauroyltransferase
MGKTLGLIMYGLDVRHRRIVRRNLKFAYPEWDWSKILRLTRRIFQNFGITALEIIQISCSSPEQMRAKAHTIQGLENLDCLSSNKGILLISAHLGNWEVSAQYVSAFIKAPFVAVSRKIRFKPFERWINGLRTRFGGELIDKQGAMPAMRKALSQGKILGVLIDQGGQGATAKFFGHDVQVHAAVALLAIRCKCPVIPAFCVREGNGFRIIIEPPLALQRTADLRADIEANIQIMMNAIERAIRRYPDQWFWFHKRWKQYYPHLYREDLEKERRKWK